MLVLDMLGMLGMLVWRFARYTGMLVLDMLGMLD
jgi:hypothetical protein